MPAVEHGQLVIGVQQLQHRTARRKAVIFGWRC